MSRDLYGEVLANVLNRKAPQNHFAAYINPDEAAMLRSQGGGVAPGGGQYMANGLPAYVGADIGFGGGGVSGVGGAAPGDTGIDPGREAARDAARVFTVGSRVFPVSAGEPPKLNAKPLYIKQR